MKERLESIGIGIAFAVVACFGVYVFYLAWNVIQILQNILGKCG
jgi:hypothetical protein